MTGQYPTGVNCGYHWSGFSFSAEKRDFEATPLSEVDVSERVVHAMFTFGLRRFWVEYDGSIFCQDNQERIL